MFIEAGSTYEVTFCTLYRSKQNFNLAIHKNEYIELSILYNKCFDTWTLNIPIHVGELGFLFPWLWILNFVYFNFLELTGKPK